ncbi:MAG TPA: Fic family protein [Candidatus Saccharibacteria bacterium]|mgnify:CR=1 FL=1|nr:Fic family protein [Candidatus Saccharibacteria bacterium]HMR38067.1 Fic family protein [Candidatus Saccharibacteria bacterium]
MLSKDESEKGAFLPILHTPSIDDKPGAFIRGFDAIRDYLGATQDSADERTEKISMAIEALIIWVHPFNDGNGRTARFIGQFIEDGTNDIDRLVASAVSLEGRPTIYDRKFATKQSKLWLANNPDIMLDDDEGGDLRREAEKLPSDAEGIYLSVKKLINDPEWREAANRHRQSGEENDR